MSDFTNASDLLKYSLRASGEIDDGNSPLHSIALEYLNKAVLMVLGGSNVFNLDLGEPFVWMRTLKHLELRPVYETGTASLTKGSTSVTFSTAPTLDGSNISLLDYDIKFENAYDWFVISAHSSGSTSATLDAAFTGDTSTTYTFKAIKVRYDLGANIIRMVEPMRVYRSQLDNDDEDKIYKLDTNAFRKKYPLRNISLGIPDSFTLIAQTDSVYKVMMNKYTDARVKVDVETVDIPTALTDSTNSIPIVPRIHRKTLGEMAAAMILKDEKKQYDDAKTFIAFAQSGLKAMISENNKQNQQAGKYRGRLLPRQ